MNDINDHVTFPQELEKKKLILNKRRAELVSISGVKAATKR